MINVVLGLASFLLLFIWLMYPPILVFFSVKPDLPIILIIFLSLYSKGKRTFFWAVLLGGLKDFLTTDLIGINIISFSLLSMILGNLEARFFFRDKKSSLFILVFCVSLANILLVNLLHGLFGVSPYSLSAILRIIILESLYTGLWSLPIIFLLKKCVLEFSTHQ